MTVGAPWIEPFASYFHLHVAGAASSAYELAVVGADEDASAARRAAAV